MFVYGGALIPERSDVPGLRGISAADASFELDDFLLFARSVHRNVHAAVAAGDAGPVDRVLEPSLRSSLLGRRADEPAWQGAVDRQDHVAAIDAEHGDHDTITVRVGARIGDRAEVEDWVFRRPAVAHPHLAGVLPTSCRACGGPLALDDNGNCRYCDTHLLGVAGEWTVVAVLAPRVLEAPRLANLPTVDTSVLGAEFRPDDFVAFARTLHDNVHRAVGDGRLAQVHDVLTTGLRAAIEAGTGDVVWGLAAGQVTDATIVDVQRGLLDVVTVRFGIQDESGPYLEDWTFERPGNHLADPPAACPFCGAAIQLDQEGCCRYCRTHLLGVGGDWRVSDARQPHQMVTHPVVIKAMQTRGGRLVLALLAVLVVVILLASIVATIAITW